MATYLVTGASGGIGCEYCRQLKERGDEVIAACRASSPDLDKLGVRVETGVDITSDAAVRGLAARLAGQPLDVLINNAGVLQSIPLDHLDFDSIRYQFEVNAIGTLRLTQALLPNLSEGSKLILMTSRMGSIGDNTSGGSYGYRMSKVAMSMAGKSLSHDLKPRGIAVAILHPGLVSTPMTNYTGIPPAESVGGLLQRIDELTLKTTGQFWHADGEVLPW
ncbi:SDR family oxidoreductase [Phormidium yuhuli AB48]|uniref:SDR family oxidoreductase n=1 Tax=Phormidium yuhuli AB48 TaxID=2940671 RepID=A0ABY5AP23_9CYAN|nr:SDR family oxidoreductase [Phormidium yuhuli]USR90531.1 SDR family oxidoreductase [Phormidium yuhuli AB48]